MSNHAHVTRTAFVALLWVTLASPIGAVDIGQDGGIELTVSFEIDPDLEDAFQAPVGDPIAEEHYCEALQHFSSRLYALTEGTHWVRSVRFFENANFRDVRWSYRDAGSGSVASYLQWMKIRENGKPEGDPTPYDSPDHSPSSLGGLLAHEFGHYFYDLPDEYINLPGSRSGHTGFCADGSYNVVGDEGQGTTCDEEALQCGGAICVFENQCIAGTEPAGTDCAEDGDCGAGGICLASSEGRAEDVDKMRICLHDTDLSIATGDDSLGVCLMAGGGLRKRWCDGGKTGSGDQVAGATHVLTFNDTEDYGVDVEFDLGDGPGIPDGSDGNTDYVEWNCWDKAAEKHIDLEGAHEIGVYPSLDDIESSEGAVPEVDCQWLVDGLGAGVHALLLVDRSGSMSYSDLSTPPVPAVDLALDGALYFYNQILNTDWIGVSVFNTTVDPATSDGTPLLYGIKSGDLDTIDGVAAEEGTDIAQAIDDAVSEILGLGGEGPWANRNIVLFTDGKFNTGDDPFAAVEAACDAGINVHTISYGDADSDALEQLADCGTAWVSGTEEAADMEFAEPDPLEMKTSVARMQHHIAGEDELYEERADLEPLTTSVLEERTFWVPEGTPLMTFTWLGNRTCAIYIEENETFCPPVLNLVTTASIISPSGAVHTSHGSAAESAGVYRTVQVKKPEPGLWTAQLDKVEPRTFITPDEWPDKVELTRVSWLAFTPHPGLEGRAWVDLRRGPTDYPVVINAQMYAGVLATGVDMTATVTHRGATTSVTLHDDGQHGDGVADDGTYGGFYDIPGDLNGNYRVKVHMSSESGHATGAPNSDTHETLRPEVIPRPFVAVVEAETSFRLSGRYGYRRDGRPSAGSISMACPNLIRGQTETVTANVVGFAIAEDDARLSLGADLDLDTIQWTCPGGCSSLGSDPNYSVTFDATVQTDAELGLRPVRVQVGPEVIESGPLCRVCASVGCDEIELAVEPLVSGEAAAMTVTGAVPGELVYFGASLDGIGPGPCPPQLGGLCLDLLPPVTLIGTAVADELGRAEVVVQLPELPGADVALQAAVARGPAGDDSVKTDAHELSVATP